VGPVLFFSFDVTKTRLPMRTIMLGDYTGTCLDFALGVAHG
jgi:hypothetical protein